MWYVRGSSVQSHLTRTSCWKQATEQEKQLGLRNPNSDRTHMPTSLTSYQDHANKKHAEVLLYTRPNILRSWTIPAIGKQESNKASHTLPMAE